MVSRLTFSLSLAGVALCSVVAHAQSAAPTPAPVMSTYAANAARLNQEALMNATRGTASRFGANPFANGATIGSTGGAKAQWETAASRRPLRPNGQKLSWVRVTATRPAPKRTGRVGVPGKFGPGLIASSPPPAERAPVMARIFSGGDGGNEPEFGNFHRNTKPEDGEPSTFRIVLH